MKYFITILIVFLGVVLVARSQCPRSLIKSRNIACGDPASNQLLDRMDLGISSERTSFTIMLEMKVSSYCSSSSSFFRLFTAYYGITGSEDREVDLKYEPSTKAFIGFPQFSLQSDILGNWMRMIISFEYYQSASVHLMTPDQSLISPFGRDLYNLTGIGMKLSICSDIGGSPSVACQISNLEISYTNLYNLNAIAYGGRGSTLLLLNKFKEGSGYMATNQGSLGGSTYFGASTASTQDTSNSPAWLTTEYGVKFTARNQYLTLPTYSHGIISPFAGTASVGIYFWLKVDSFPALLEETDTMFSYNNANLVKLYSIGITKWSQQLTVVVAKTSPYFAATIRASEWIQIFVYFSFIDRTSKGYFQVSIRNTISMSQETSYSGLLTTDFKATDVVRIGGFIGQISDFRIYSPASPLFNSPSCTASCPYDIGIMDRVCLQPVCGSGTYASSNCINCPSTCGTCTSTGTCQTCPKGSTLINGNCSPCPSAQYADHNGVCQQCPTDCETCTSSSSCQSCSTGKGLSGGLCVTCPLGTQIKNGFCSTCTSTQYADNQGKCQNCPTDCTSCTNSTSCQSCSSGKGIVDGLCVTCLSGTFPGSPNCQECPAYCTACTNSTSCQSCEHGYGLLAGICVICPGATFLYNDICQACPTDCAYCSDPFTCNLCSTGKGLFEGLCVTCPAGTKLRNGYCSTCSPTQYVSRQGNCGACRSECATCESRFYCESCESGKGILESGLCGICPAGYYADPNSKCQSCPIGCLTCVSSTSCQSCNDGYILSEVCLLEPDPDPELRSNKIGIGVGVGVSGAVILIGVACCVYKKRRLTRLKRTTVSTSQQRTYGVSQARPMEKRARIERGFSSVQIPIIDQSGIKIDQPPRTISQSTPEAPCTSIVTDTNSVPSLPLLPKTTLTLKSERESD